MWWHDLLWGLWNGFTGWVVLIVHIFGGWDDYHVYDPERIGNWYDIGFLIGASSPLFGIFSGKSRTTSTRER